MPDIDNGHDNTLVTTPANKVPQMTPSATHMDDLIKLVNRLQDALSSVSLNNPIDLPQIVVIGRYLCFLIPLLCIASRAERVRSWRISWEETFCRVGQVL